MQNMLVKEKVLKEANTPYAKRIWNYPPEIITELLVQAIWHHAYWKNQPVRILLAFNSIQITISTDLADTDFKEETFWKRCRNPRIGELFTWLGLLDESQIEFASIKQAVKENGSAHMEFFYDGQNNRLSVLVPMHPCFVKKSTLKEEAYQKKILAILETQPLTLTRLSAAMGYKSITSKLRQSVNLLLEQGRVVYVRSKKREKRLGLDKTR
jgi:ATP-dependent DNA helicase RecG